MNQTAGSWVTSMMTELSTSDPHKAVRGLGAGLTALRDLLTPAQAARFSARLPLVIRGLFFEGWDPTVPPRQVRQRSQFLALLGQKYAPHSDVPTDVLASAFVAVLYRQLGGEEMGELAPIALTSVIDFGWAPRQGLCPSGTDTLSSPRRLNVAVARRAPALATAS